MFNVVKIFFIAFSFSLLACSMNINEFNASYDKNEYYSSYSKASKFSKSDKLNALLFIYQSSVVAFDYVSPAYSIYNLDIADELFQQNFGKSAISNIGKEALSVISGDLSTPYKGYFFENSMVNFYKALGYMYIGDAALARVEFNRANDVQRRALEYYDKQLKQARKSGSKDKKSLSNLQSANKNIGSNIDLNYQILSEYRFYENLISPLISYTSGIFFMLEKDYSKSYDLIKEAYGMTNLELIKQDLSLAYEKDLRKDTYTWILIADGDIGRKKAEVISIPFIGLDGSTQFYSIGLGKFVDGKEAFSSYLVNNQKASELVNLSALLVAELKKQNQVIITKKIVNILVQMITHATLNQVNPYLGLLGDVFFRATALPDIRNVVTLPNKVFIARIKNDTKNIAISANGRKIAEFSLSSCQGSQKRQAFSKEDLKKKLEKEDFDNISHKNNIVCSNADNIIYLRIRNDFTNKFIIKGK